ncbi:hypothetical protein K439DRAFT_1643390 [Ramaria rubella]|nr:hypothetical protein K439DRAFT_1643390 [Ramaria rubella]
MSTVLKVASLFCYSPYILLTASDIATVLQPNIPSSSRAHSYAIWSHACALFKLQANQWVEGKCNWPRLNEVSYLPGLPRTVSNIVFPLELKGSLPPPIPRIPYPTSVLSIYINAVPITAFSIPAASDFYRRTLPTHIRGITALYTTVYRASTPHGPVPAITHYLVLPQSRPEDEQLAGNAYPGFDLYRNQVPLSLADDLQSLLKMTDPSINYLILFSMSRADPTRSLSELVSVTSRLSEDSAVAYCCSYDFLRPFQRLYTDTLIATHSYTLTLTESPLMSHFHRNGLDYILAMTLRSLRLIAPKEQKISADDNEAMHELRALGVQHAECEQFLLIRSHCYRHRLPTPTRDPYELYLGRPPGTAVPFAFLSR